MPQATCQVNVNGKPCGRPVRAKGLCPSHYSSERRRQRKAAAPPPPEPSSTIVRKIQSKYSTQQIEEALLAVIMHGGNKKLAAELVGIPYDTVKGWVMEHAPRYAELRREKGPELERMAVDGLLSFVTAAEEAKHMALEATMGELRAGTVKDASSALRNVATAQGISVTKIMELTGRPTANNAGVRSAQELLSALARLGAITNSTPSTAEELPVLPVLDSGDQHSQVAAAADSTEAER